MAILILRRRKQDYIPLTISKISILLTLPEEIKVRVEDFPVVRIGQPAKVLTGQLAEFPANHIEASGIHFVKIVFLDGPVQPLPDMVWAPKHWICRQNERKCLLLNSFSIVLIEKNDSTNY